MFRRVGIGLLLAAAGALALAAPAAAQTAPIGAEGANYALADVDTSTFVDVFGVPVPVAELFRPLDVIAQAVAAAPCAPGTGSAPGSSGLGCTGSGSFLNIQPGS